MAPFSPSDVIEEYHAARIVRDGETVTVPALTDDIALRLMGRTEWMHSTLAYEVSFQPLKTNMAEYTVRWPHISIVLSEGDSIPEQELLTAWEFDSTRPEFTWMKVRCQQDLR